MKTEVISLVHGSGGAATGDLIKGIFAEAFGYDPEQPLEDAAVLMVPAGNGGNADTGQLSGPIKSRIALTTDSFVVTPVIFRGGDIGRLSVCGTVNDLLSRGAVPKYLTAGFILEEGLPVGTLKSVVRSMAETAKEAGVSIVTGDTKVIEGRGTGESGLFINTAGIGVFPAQPDRGPSEARSTPRGSERPELLSAANPRPGDAIIVSGTMGDHHAAILSERLSIETDIESDCAPLGDMVGALIENDVRVRTIRDVTRGGLATVLKELAEASCQAFVIEEEAVPVDPKVRDFCGLLGLDPLYMGNEGKLAAIVDPEDAEKAVDVIRSCRYGGQAAKIGSVIAPAGASEAEGESPEFPFPGGAGRQTGGLTGVRLAPGDLIMRTKLGGLRTLTVLQGEGLPRIC